MKKIRKIFSLISAMALTVSMLPCFSASADDGVIVKYTFDSETTKTLPFNDATYTTLDYACYDGYENTFLYANSPASIWSSGWNTYTRDALDAVPSASEMYISGGKLNLAMNNGDFFAINLPINPDAQEERLYNISFDMTRNIGSGAQFLRFGIGNRPVFNEANDVTFARKGGNIANFTSGSAKYDMTVGLKPGDMNVLYITAVNPSIGVAIDTFTITEIGSSEVVDTFPADGAENVTTYINPIVTFNNGIDKETISKIRIICDDEIIKTTNSLDATGKVVTLETAEQLPANKEVTIRVPETVLGAGGNPVVPADIKFTTGDKNVILDYDFEKENVYGDLGMMFGFAGWGSVKELAPNAPIDGSQALKVTNTVGWHEITIDVVNVNAKDNMKIVGGNINRMYEIEYDMYLEGSGKYYTLYEPQYGASLNKRAHTTFGEVIHVKDVITVTSSWDPRYRLRTEDASQVVAYIDNFKMTEIVAETGAPAIVSATPENGAEGVRATSNIEIQFNQGLVESSFEDVALFKLSEDENADPIPVEIAKTLSTDFVGRTKLTVNPAGVLDPSSTYALDLASVRNANNQALDEETEQAFIFTTSDVALDKPFATFFCDGEAITDGKITADMAGKKLEVKFDGFGLVESAQSYNGIIAVYVNDAYEWVDFAPVTAENGEAKAHSLSVTLPESLEDAKYSVSTFLWNGLTPYAVANSVSE